ncbi:uncharacterized protein BDZ99DRAFT_275963 [Mytilinidion resinicola]|uniref:GYF domain-containing protein n=1 Tax=Mytilinidion resinicola TaxID=574789 RepID=A0A6A6YU16_9PEZI|nr:uncharacterized protein BDZ99DRAFT_275963 [Mytilinidion resinicola]KAF2811465.1 hypothetical protein BDZ99DRAFT_275963 [Mytilinidion resinicola]
MAGKNGFTAPRPKRAGDQFTRTHHGEGDGHSPKKARFDYRNPSTLAPDAPEEDAILELDEIGRSGGTKRNAVNIDGYESDSSTENFDTRADGRAKAKAQAEAEAKEDDSDEDIFGGADDKDGVEDPDPAQAGKLKKRAVRFLDGHEIQGQVDESKSGGHVSADFSLSGKSRQRDDESSSESGDDEERDRIGSDVDEEIGAGGKKKHAPKLDAFNMKNEGEEGRFDESGNFVRKAADPDAVHDTWLDGISKKDLKSAREAHEKREAERRQRALADDSVLTSDVLSTLITHMEKGETVLESLQRLGKGKPKEKKKPKWQKNKRKNGDDMDLDSDKTAEDPAETKRREAVEAITGAADQLMTRGQTDVYDDEREKLIRQYKKDTGDDWVEPIRAAVESGSTDTKMWEYKWSDARDGGEKHGPYDGPTMVAWNDAGYFGEGVEFRRIGDSEWSRVVDFV